VTHHAVYSAIVKAVKSGQLKEPFGNQEFRSNCPGFGEGTYRAFLHKHRKGNPGGNSELFELVSKGRFRLVRPFKYGLYN
jgi:hypothetical protein